MEFFDSLVFSSGEATVEGVFADEAIERAVRAAGFSL